MPLSKDDQTPIEIENARAAIRDGIGRAKALVDEYGRAMLADVEESEAPKPPNPA